MTIWKKFPRALRLGLAALGLLCGLPPVARAQEVPLADVIVVIDTSRSMEFEIGQFISEINSLAQGVSSSGVDLSLIVVSNDVCLSGIGDNLCFDVLNGGSTRVVVCVPPPLGSGTCPADENAPAYRHVRTRFPSFYLLDGLLEAYPDFANALRPGAARHVVVVTDDNSRVSAESFDAALRALDPSFEDYRFHAFVATTPGGRAPVGTEYLNLATLTGGTSANLLNPTGGSFAAALDAVGQSVSESVGPAVPPVAQELTRRSLNQHVVETRHFGVMLKIRGHLADLPLTGNYVAQITFPGTLPIPEAASCSLSLDNLPPRTKRALDVQRTPASVVRCELEQRKDKAVLRVFYMTWNHLPGTEYLGQVVIRRGQQVVFNGSATTRFFQ